MSVPPTAETVRATLPITWQFDPGVDIAIASRREATLAGTRAEVPAGQIHSLRDRMPPSPARVAAITPRSRELCERAGIPIGDDPRRARGAGRRRHR